MVIGAGLIGIYASGSETSDDAGEPVASSTPQRPTASPIASASPATVLGSFDDRYDFRSFAERLAVAIDGGDVGFFMANVTFVPIDCTLRGMPPPPDSCKDEPSGASVPGVLLEAWNTDHPHFDADEYEQFIREFLSEPAALTSDGYGDAEPKLHAYALFRPQYLVYANSLPFPPVSSVQAQAYQELNKVDYFADCSKRPFNKATLQLSLHLGRAAGPVQL